MSTIFPINPEINDEYQGYRWNGVSWKIIGVDLTADYPEIVSGYISASVIPTSFATKQYVDTNIGNIDLTTYLTQSSASTTYLTKTSASSTYLSQSSASTNYATKTYADTAASNAAAAIVNSAPSTLDTLNELAAALGNDANYATTITNALALKSPIASPTFTGTTTSPNIRLTSTTDVSLSSTGHALQIGDSASANIRMDINEILAVNNGANATLNLQTDGGLVLIGNNVVDGTSSGAEVHGPLRFESSLGSANNSGQSSMRAKIGVNSTADRQEFQIYAAGDAYSTGSLGSGIHLYGVDDRQHAGNISFLTGPPDQGDARMIIAGGTGTTGYINGVTTYTRTNTDTRVTIGNSLWDWVDTKQDTGLLNLKDASSRPSIYITSSGNTDGTTYGTIGFETGTDFGIGHWSGTAYTNRLSISSTGAVSIGGTLSVTGHPTFEGVTATGATGTGQMVFSIGPTFTGTVTLPSTTSIGNVSSTELGYVDGVTSAIQTQLDAKQPLTLSINAQSGTSYTLVSSDNGKIIEMNNASANTLTIPTNASVEFPIGTQITILQTGAGQTTIGGSGVTINGTPGLKLRTQWSSATLIKRATNTWVVIGDLVA